ncbi:MAG: T9SS type A sorting domain-containing protein [Flavobacteriales bacterium]|nr:T9SS type A sorting domain-containing protein [Flavobacteriales bacterium]
MKHTLTLLYIICPLFLCAQTVNHFENSTSKWFVADTYPNGNQQNPSFVQTTTTVYGFAGDTTIQGELWFKTYSSSDTSFTTGLEFQGLLKADDGYVVFQDPTNAIDTLYNFNLELGDSVLYNFWGQNEEYIYVVDIDSIPINGEMYKRLSFDEPIFGFFLMDERWIEGIGSIHGPLFPLHPEAFSTEAPSSLDLVCSHVGQILYWDNQFYNTCAVNIILDVENAEASNFDIYPNPSTDQIFIRQQQTTSGQFFVRDILGKEVLSGSLLSDNQSVDISKLKDGVYVVTVLLDDTTLTKKILKY